MKRKKYLFAIATVLSLMLASCGGTSDTKKDMAANEGFQEADVIGDFADLPPNEDNYVNPFSDVDNPENYNILALAAKDANFSTFRRLAAMGNLDLILKSDKNYTVFMPTNEAFKKMPEEKFEKLIDPANRAQLGLFLQRHILVGKHTPMDFNETQAIETVAEEEITVSTNNPGDISMVGGAHVIGSGTEASNGIIYAVDAIVEPTKDVFTN
ncbi:hypothetical protein C7S20_11640 [Christiangramia fulva]|uniref:FAS1 domain-containing protein n=1 Tax=Christiangramia fulva TaxID=2126553 RepID=A0A2R3Z6E6_9FLAO|nr:fasciclin domain-containing protein [Christiangramia fulva]AVR45851.1 hypothetical protein C7S20_11640 [Christiangramia fulva]